MEPIASVVDRLKGFAKSTQDFANGVFQSHHNSIRRNPIEILKRLQREAFSDIMKLRDRQDKVERVLSFYKTSKGSPFEEASTHLRGEVEFLEALLMTKGIGEQNFEAIRRAGVKTGIHSKFIFETTVRKKDNLVAEFLASDRGVDVLGSPLSLSKVFYAANISDWFSAVAIPVGAHCRDVEVGLNSCQRRGLTNYSSFGPPLLNQHYGSALGLMVRRSNIIASLARLVSGVEMPPGSFEIMQCFGTFGQVVFQLPRNTKLSLLGVHQGPKRKLSTNQVSLGPLSLPLGLFQRRQTFVESSDPSIQTHIGENNAARSIALTVESELDESTRIGGWVEMKTSNNPKSLQWAVTMSDTPEDDFGWGLSLGGSIQGPRSWDHFQVECFLKFNFGKRFSLQPALVHVMDGTTQFPALMLRSTWSL